jgi:hypothetical protein
VADKELRARLLEATQRPKSDEAWKLASAEGSDKRGLRGGAGLERYFASQDLRACFWLACFSCFAARFSFRVRPGFLGWLDGVDFVAITEP